MSILPQSSLFSWQKVDRSAPIALLKATLDALPDQALLRVLISERKGRRNDYPVVAVWRALVAGALLGHRTRVDLIAELRRNAELRQVCGFEPFLGEKAVPPEPVFSRLCRKLERHEDLLLAMFEEMVEALGTLLPDLGRQLAVDSKALVVRGRRPADAGVGIKTYESVDGEGRSQTSVVQWFGYKLHLLVDARYELPLACKVTEANRADSPQLMPLVEHLKKEHPAILARTETLAADKGYDDGADKADLWDNHAIKPLIPPRDLWKENRVRPLDEQRSDTVYFGPTGEVSCRIDPLEPDPAKAYAAMQYQGFEPTRNTLKFRCPAAAFGLECRNRDACQCIPRVREGQYGRVVRVPLERDRRIFMPIHAQSRTFERAYKGRTSIERVNSRIDRVHGLEWALVNSLQTMTLRVSLAMLAMIASATAWIRAEQPEKMRQLLRAA
jgi:IS5 family transposase